MEGIAAEIRRLSVRTEGGMKIACPRPGCYGAMVILDRGDFELVLICSMCSRERVSERVDEAGRRMAPVLKRVAKPESTERGSVVAEMGHDGTGARPSGRILGRWAADHPPNGSWRRHFRL